MKSWLGARVSIPGVFPRSPDVYAVGLLFAAFALVCLVVPNYGGWPLAVMMCVAGIVMTLFASLTGLWEKESEIVVVWGLLFTRIRKADIARVSYARFLSSGGHMNMCFELNDGGKIAIPGQQFRNADQDEECFAMLENLLGSLE